MCFPFKVTDPTTGQRNMVAVPTPGFSSPGAAPMTAPAGNPFSPNIPWKPLVPKAPTDQTPNLEEPEPELEPDGGSPFSTYGTIASRRRRAQDAMKYGFMSTLRSKGWMRNRGGVSAPKMLSFGPGTAGGGKGRYG